MKYNYDEPTKILTITFQDHTEKESYDQDVLHTEILSSMKNNDALVFSIEFNNKNKDEIQTILKNLDNLKALKQATVNPLNLDRSLSTDLTSVLDNLVQPPTRTLSTGLFNSTYADEIALLDTAVPNSPLYLTPPLTSHPTSSYSPDLTNHNMVNAKPFGVSLSSSSMPQLNSPFQSSISITALPHISNFPTLSSSSNGSNISSSSVDNSTPSHLSPTPAQPLLQDQNNTTDSSLPKRKQRLSDSPFVKNCITILDQIHPTQKRGRKLKNVHGINQEPKLNLNLKAARRYRERNKALDIIRAKGAIGLDTEQQALKAENDILTGKKTDSQKKLTDSMARLSEAENRLELTKAELDNIKILLPNLIDGNEVGICLNGPLHKKVCVNQLISSSSSSSSSSSTSIPTLRENMPINSKTHYQNGSNLNFNPINLYDSYAASRDNNEVWEALGELTENSDNLLADGGGPFHSSTLSSSNNANNISYSLPVDHSPEPPEDQDSTTESSEHDDKNSLYAHPLIKSCIERANKKLSSHPSLQSISTQKNISNKERSRIETAAYRLKNTTIQQEINDTGTRLTEEVETLEKQNASHKTEITTLEIQIAATEKQMESTQAELNCVQEELSRVQAELHSMNNITPSLIEKTSRLISSIGLFRTNQAETIASPQSTRTEFSTSTSANTSTGTLSTSQKNSFFDSPLPNIQNCSSSSGSIALDKRLHKSDSNPKTTMSTRKRKAPDCP
ncbi:MAG: hypothetical protein KIT27_10085 [Legionellales bacterium]|nr:hypothetical protein [Legionellales bacterium]